MTSIGWYAFEGCSGLTSIEIPNSVTIIGGQAFNGCSNITIATIPTIAISYIPKTNLQTVVINGGTNIERHAFEDCSNLTSVHITDISAWCGISFANEFSNPLFYAHSLYLNGTLITDLVIPDNVTNIWLAFIGCSNLTSITVQDGNTKYHSDGNCVIDTATQTLVVGCKNSVIPDDGSVTSIGRYAFESCCGLTSIEIPNSVTIIGLSAFEYCSSLTSVYYKGTQSEFNNVFNGNTSFTEAMVYFYSQNPPTDHGYYWHYDTDGITPVVWAKEN